jgi:hypothetical protein
MITSALRIAARTGGTWARTRPSLPRCSPRAPVRAHQGTVLEGELCALRLAPLLSAGDALSLAEATDGVLVVARQSRTRRERKQALQTALEELGTRKVAIVLMDART